MREPPISVGGVTKVFRSGLPRREVVAVEGLDLEVERGSVVAFVGPNGAGKTTTIRILLGLLDPEEGEVSIFGEPPGSVEARSRIGFMSEIFHTYPFHSARRALRFYGRLSRMQDEEIDGRLRSLLIRVGLGAAANRKVGTFSKGMTQRLGLAQALLHGPDLLILDEPTTGLDPEGRRLVADLIDEERERGTTVFLSSHILSDVERSCDRVVMLGEGRVVFEGSLDDLGSGSSSWRILVRGLEAPQRETLSGEGLTVEERGQGVAGLVCSREEKEPLLRRLLEGPVEIVGIEPAGPRLEDLYLEHLGTRPGT